MNRGLIFHRLKFIRYGFTLVAVQFGFFPSAQAQEVSTSTRLATGVRYYHSETHPTKFDWGSFTFCGGRNASDDEKSATGEAHSNSNRGSIAASAGVNGPLFQMVGAQLAWETRFDKEDYVFHIDIKREVGKNDFHETSSVCNTHHWDYKIDNVTTDVSASVRLTIPANVWVMRIKADSKGPLTNYYITKVVRLPYRTIDRPVENTIPSPELGEPGTPLKETLGSAISDNYSYFFTKPGEEIQIFLKFNDKNVSNLELVASFEVTFIGANRCDSTIREILGDGLGLGQSGIASKVRAAYQTLESVIHQTPTQEGLDRINRATVFIGCMMNEGVSHSIFYNHDAAEIRDLLFETKSFEERIRKSVSEVNSLKHSRDALFLISQMAFTSLSSSLLDSVKPYCISRPLFDANGGQIGVERGYVQMTRNLQKARSLFALNEQLDAYVGYSRYYHELLDAYMPFVVSGRSYKDLRNDPALKPKLVDFAKLFQANNKVTLSQRALGALAQMPELRPTNDVIEMTKAALEVDRLTLRLHGYFAREIEKYLLNRDKQPDVSGVEEDIAALSRESLRLRSHLNRVYSIVALDEDGEVAAKFKTAVEDVTADFLAAPETWLKDAYGGYFIDFLTSVDPELKPYLNSQGNNRSAGFYYRNSIKEISKCLSSSISKN